MTRERFVQEAVECGWQPWGKLKRKRGSGYQCFRKGRKYIWIGLRYVEHQDIDYAADFVSDAKEAKSFLEEWI